MLPKIAHLTTGLRGHRRWGCLVCGLAILTLPTWTSEARSQFIGRRSNVDPKADPQLNETTTKSAGVTPKSHASIPAAIVRRPALPPMAPPGVEYLPQPLGEEKRILEVLEERVEFNFSNESLDAILAILSEHHGIQFMVDESKLEEESVTADVADVTLKLSGVTLRSGLKILLKRKHLDYLIEDEVLRVTTKTDAITCRTTRTYPVRDLVGSVDVDYELLLQTIQQSTGGPPDHPWIDADGEGGSVSALPATGCLVIRQTAHVHDEILQLLRAIRKANQETHLKTTPLAPTSQTRVPGLNVEVLNSHVSDARHYPLVGKARLATARISAAIQNAGATQVISHDGSFLIPVN